MQAVAASVFDSLTSSDWWLSLLSDFRDILGEMAPFLLFGFLFAGILSMVIRQSFVEKHLGGRGLLPSVKASLFGVPLPLCSCGIIPVSASLRLNGASKGATTSFIISTPQTGVDSLMVTYSLLGWVFTIFRAIAAFVSGIIGGWAVDLLDGNDSKKHDHSQEKSSSHKCAESNCSDSNRLHDSHSSCCSGDSCCSTHVRHKSKLMEGLHFAFIALPKDIGKPLLIGLLITVLIGIFVPDSFFSETIGNEFLSMLIMLLIAIPMYVCATASVPIAFALLEKGASPGAALVFLMTGPATNAAAIATFWKILGKKTTVIYLISVIVTAIAAGLLLDNFFEVDKVTKSGMGVMLPVWFRDFCSLLLLINLAYVFLPRRKKIEKEVEAPMTKNEHRILVEGMTCHHCKTSVENAISAFEGVNDVEVDLDTKEAKFWADSINIDEVLDTIRKLGYEPKLLDK